MMKDTDLVRITTAVISLKLLLTGQPLFMQQNGLHVQMLSADGPEKATVLANENCPHTVIPFTRKITPLQDLKCLWLLILFFRKHKPQIVHTHTPKAGLLGMLAARLAGVPIRIHTIAGLPFMTSQGLRRRLLIAIEKITYWGAQHVWPNSASMLAYVKEQRLCPERKLDMIAGGSTNGISLDEYSKENLQKQVLAEIKTTFDYDANCTWIMAVGRIVKDKGIPELIEAFEALQVDRPALRLLLVGPIEKVRAEEFLPFATISSMENNPNIHHIAWTDEVAYYLHLADVLVHASHREGFPNVPLQAGAMECPIVCSAIPGNVDIVAHEETGYTFPVGDVAALKQTLERSLDHRAEATEMAQRLRQKVENSFDRKVVHGALLRRYQALMTRL